MKPLRLLCLASLLPLVACSKADIRTDGASDGPATGGEGGTGGLDAAADTDDGAPGGQGGGGQGGIDLGGAGGGAGATAGAGGSNGGKGGGLGGATGGATGGKGGQTGGQGAGGVNGGGHGGQGTGGAEGGGASGGGGQGGAGGNVGGGSGNAGAGGAVPVGGGGAGGAGGAVACVAQAITGAPIKPSAAGQLVVSELMHSTVSPISDNAGEWFELYNPSPTTAYDLKDCVISDNYMNPSNTPKMATIIGSVVIPPCSYGALAIAPAPSPGFTPLYAYGTGSSSTSVKFGNDHDDGVRVSCGGMLIAAFHYSTSDAGNTSYDGHSFSVDPAHFDAVGGTPGTYCPGKTVYPQGGTNYGTPGGPNPSCEP